MTNKNTYPSPTPALMVYPLGQGPADLRVTSLLTTSTLTCNRFVLLYVSTSRDCFVKLPVLYEVFPPPPPTEHNSSSVASNGQQVRPSIATRRDRVKSFQTEKEFSVTMGTMVTDHQQHLLRS